VDAFNKAGARAWEKCLEERRARFRRETLIEVANPMGKAIGRKRRRAKPCRALRDKERSRSARAEKWANLLERLRLNASYKPKPSS